MTGQNRSSAVMQQRHAALSALDDFPTPPWATRALCDWLGRRYDLSTQIADEPAANRGHMVRPLLEYFGVVQASDVHDYGAGFALRDYLIEPAEGEVHWTITNPPFVLAEEFALQAVSRSRSGAALFVRSAFLESVGRYRRLFSLMPPSDVLQFTERVVLHEHRLAPKGSTATAYCWLVWDHARISAELGTQFDWIAPCRKRLERAGDYPEDST